MYSIHRWCRIDRNGCVNCGGRSFEQAQVIANELARTWELSHRERVWFDEREGHFCQNCRMSKRVRMLLWSVRKIYGELKNLDVLHLNQINDLNQALSRAGRLVETAYYPEKELGAAINGLSNQDMTHLTFSNNCFDLVIHSETLEHLHDYELALIEAKRVLKPGGYHVYSVPLLHDRQTRRRIAKDTVGNFIPLLPLSTHGIEGEYPVVWEFGGDFIKQRRDQIFEIDYDSYRKNRTVFTIVERKEP